MGDGLITKSLRRSQHTLANIIGLGNIKKHVMDEILCMDCFREEDLELFDSFACRDNARDHIEETFECFLKIAGIESVIAKILDYHCIHEKLPNGSGVLCSESNVPISQHFCKTQPFKGFKVFDMAKSMLSTTFDDSKVNILAYLICIDKSTYYEGEYEVFYIIDYLVKGCPSVGSSSEAAEAGTDEYGLENKQVKDYKVQGNAAKVLSNWAENCTVPFNSSILLFDSTEFFESEVLYVNDLKLLCSIIVARKSHKILLSRLWFITNSFSYQDTDATSSSLCDLLMSSYSNDNKSTNEIILQLGNETLAKSFVSKTGASLRSFFQVCRKVDPLYITCMNLCIEHFSTVCDRQDGIAQLRRVCMSRYFRVDSFQGFQQVVRTLRENKLPIPVEKLCNVREKEVCSTAELANGLEMHCKIVSSGRKSLRISGDGRKEVMDRAIHLLEDSAVPLKLLKKLITRKYPRHSVIIMLRSESFKLFAYGYARLSGVSLEKKADAKTAATTDSFCELLLDELQKLECSRFYQKIMGFLLRKKVIKSCLMPATLCPFALALVSKLGKSSPDMLQLEERLSEGLYFYRSMLRLSGLYRKFVFGCKVVLYKEWLRDMPIMRLGKELSIDVCNCDVVLNNGANSVRLLSIADGEISQGRRCQDAVPSGQSLGSFGMIYGSTTGPERISVTDVSRIRAFSEQLEIRISFVYSHGRIDIALNETVPQRLPVGEISCIDIGKKFYGVLKSLFYAETTEMGPPPMTGPEMYKLYDEYIDPMEKLLRYKSRKGIFIDTLKPFYLSSSRDFLVMDNIIEHRKVRDVKFYN